MIDGQLRHGGPNVGKCPEERPYPTCAIPQRHSLIKLKLDTKGAGCGELEFGRFWQFNNGLYVRRCLTKLAK